MASGTLVPNLGARSQLRSHTADIPSLLGVVPTKLVGNPINFSVGQTRLGGLIVVLLILGVPLWILRGVAKRGTIAANYVGKIDRAGLRKGAPKALSPSPSE